MSCDKNASIQNSMNAFRFQHQTVGNGRLCLPNTSVVARQPIVTTTEQRTVIVISVMLFKIISQ